MPIYEYECENKHRFEKWQSMKDEPVKECPECGSSVRKILHPAGIIFKGSGWYITDSRKSSGEESKSGSGSVKSEAKGGVSDTKPEAKSETANEPKAGKADSSSTGKSDSSSSS